MLNEFLGTRLKIVSGYQGNSTMVVAMERGEVDGGHQFLGQLEVAQPGLGGARRRSTCWCRPSRKPRSSDIPSVQDLARNDDDRQIIQLIVSGDALGKPLATAPNVPAERVQALRDAFDATIKDPAFIEAAATARVEINPIPGVTIQKTVEKVLATPKNLAERAKTIIAE